MQTDSVCVHTHSHTRCREEGWWYKVFSGVYVACVNKTFCGIFRTGINEEKGDGAEDAAAEPGETIKLRYTLMRTERLAFTTSPQPPFLSIHKMVTRP